MGTGSSAIEKTKQLGNQYFAKGDYKKALSAYSKALRYDPTNHVLLSNRSACNLKLLDFKDALEDALACVAASPQWNKGYFRVASTLQVCGLQSESLYYYSISLSISADALTVSKCEELSKLVKFKGRNTVLIWGVAQPRPMSLKALEGLQVAEM